MLQNIDVVFTNTGKLHCKLSKNHVKIQSLQSFTSVVSVEEGNLWGVCISTDKDVQTLIIPKNSEKKNDNYLSVKKIN